MNLAALALLTLTGAPVSGSPVYDHVDVIEVNHFYDKHGKLVFDQAIFYEWDDKEGRFQVIDWRLIKKPSQIPRRDWKRGDYVCVWSDGETLRVVRAKSYRETWTQYDPELVERQFLPKEYRKGLTSLRRPKGSSR